MQQHTGHAVSRHGGAPATAVLRTPVPHPLGPRLLHGAALDLTCASLQHDTVQLCSRRSTLALLGTATSVLLSPPPRAAAEPSPAAAQALYVTPQSGTGQTASPPPNAAIYPSINAALSALASARKAGMTEAASILVSAGTYRERIVLGPGIGPLTISAWPQSAAVEVVWETQEPYESVIDCSARGVTVSHLSLRHASKSVANNYGVYIREGSDMVMDSCDVTSTTGSGVGVEDASPRLLGCRFHDCARHGVAVFGPLDPLSETPGGGVVQDCQVYSNSGEGVLVKGGAAPSVTDCDIHDNKGWGLSIQSSGGHYERNTVTSNSRGALQVLDCPLDTDPDTWVRENTLKGTVTLTG